MNARTCLFGGTLLSVGMAAHAQEFIYLDGGTLSSGSYTNSYAISRADGASRDVAIAPDPLNTFNSATTSDTGTSTWMTTQTPDSMRAEGEWAGDGTDGNGAGYAFFLQFFEVTAPAGLLLEWDAPGVEDAFTFVSDVTAGTGIFSWSSDFGDPQTGSASVGLAPGRTYLLLMGFVDRFDVVGPSDTAISIADETQFASARLIPAPGAVGLFAMSSLGLVRRRR